MGLFSRDPIDPPLRCSFCSKDQAEVKKLIAGPEVFICDECVSVCIEIVAEREPIARASDATEPIAVRPLSSDEAEDLLPAEHHEATTTIVTCALCRMRFVWEDAITVPDRGALCPGCVSAIEAAIAEWREGRV